MVETERLSAQLDRSCRLTLTANDGTVETVAR